MHRACGDRRAARAPGRAAATWRSSALRRRRPAVADRVGAASTGSRSEALRSRSAGRPARRTGDRRTKNALPFMPRVLGPARDGDVHRGRRLRRRRDASSGSGSTARLRPQRRGHAQLRRRRARHPQLDLRLPRRGHHATSCDFQDDFPDAHVVKLEQNYRSTQTHPRRRQRGHLATTAGGWARRCGPTSARATRSRSASSTTSTPRRGSSSARSSGSSTRASSRAEIAVFYRTNAQSRVLEDTLVRARDRLPGHRRHEVLRARGDQGRGRVPDVARQPAGRHRRSRASPTRRGAGSGRRRCRACSRTRTRWASRSGTPRPSRRASPGWARRRSKALRALHGHDGRGCASGPRTASRSATCSRRCCSETGYLDALEAERTIEAQGRIENLEELVEVGARVRRHAPRRRRHARRVPAADLARRRRRHAPRRRGPRDADDAPQREGPRVPDRLHDRLRGGRLPALALARRGRRSRRSGGSATSASRARCATSTSPTRAAARVVRRARATALPLALPRRDPARADRSDGAPARRRRAGRRAGRAGARGRRAAVARRRADRRRRRRASASATTSSTPRSARAS